MNTFSSLFSEGFCTQSQQDDSKAGDQSGGKLQDDVEGTGMGEGQGKQDVSEQMTDEGQLEGDSASKKEEGKDEEAKEERAKEEEGVEMTSEFEGEMKDLEQNEQQVRHFVS